jgi:hypothetical protein
MKKYFVALLFAFCIIANANVQLPLLFSDGMVLQRDKPIHVWGWADANEKIAVSVTLKNMGKVDGKEALQLYSSKSDSKITLATQELKGFQKVLIAAGKSETIAIQVPVKELAYYNVETKKWTVEPGNYTLKLEVHPEILKKKFK